MDEVRPKVQELMDICHECKQKPELWEITFFGSAVPKFIVKCGKCGQHTEYFLKAKNAVIAWNKGYTMPKREMNENIDDDCLVDLMGQVMARASEDYISLASREYLTKSEKTRLRDVEEFIYENPYMLPYDREYVFEEMDRLVEAKKPKNPRKKQVS